MHVDIDAVGDHTHTHTLTAGACAIAAAFKERVQSGGNFWSQSRHSKGAELLPLATSKCRSCRALASPFLRVSVISFSFCVTGDK